MLTVVKSAADVEDDAGRFLFGVRSLGVRQRAGSHRLAVGNVILVVVGGLHAQPAATKLLN